MSALFDKLPYVYIRRNIIYILLSYLNLFYTPSTQGMNIYTQDEVIVSNPTPFIEGINKAQKYIFLGTYKIHDNLLPNKQVLEALKKAAARGVHVTLLIEKNLTRPEKKEGHRNVKKGDSLLVYKSLGVNLAECPRRFAHRI